MPIFMPELIDKIVLGDKTQTRRPIKSNEELREWTEVDGLHKRVVLLCKNGNYRTKMETGRTYAVIPGRGQFGILWNPETKVTIAKDAHELVISQAGAALANGFVPLRIRVLDIREEDVRHISLEDVEAEGFCTRDEFWEVWCGFYDKPGLAIIAAHKPYNVVVRTGLLERPDDLYQAWAYTFEVLR